MPKYRGLLARCPAEFALCSKVAARADGFFAQSGLVFTDSGELAIFPKGRHEAEPGQTSRVVTGQVGAADRPEVYGMNLTQVFDFMGMDRGYHRESARVGVHLQRFGDVYVRAMPDTLKNPAAFTTCFESSSSSTYTAMGGAVASTQQHQVAATALSLSRSIFIELMLKRRLFLLYRRKLILNLVEFNGGPPRPTAPGALGCRARDMLETNRIDASHCPVILREFHVGQNDGSGDGEPIWWDNLVLMLGDGDGSIRARVSVVCGIPVRPDAPSEGMLPWFAIFCDKGGCGGWGESGERNGETGQGQCMRYG